MNIKKILNEYMLHDTSLYGKNNIEDSLAMLYHENSKLTSKSAIELGIRISKFNNEYVVKRSSQPFKCYPGHKTIDLSKYKNSKIDINFFSLINKRRSLRNFDPNYNLSLNELSSILYNSYGVTYREESSASDVVGNIGFRNAPSPGALYPLEIYIVIFKSHIPSGLYHYRPDLNCLEVIRKGNFIDELSTIIKAEPYINIRNSTFLIMTTGVIERVIIKYGDRGYRFLLQESGFVGLLINLIAESLSLGSCWVGGYIDDDINTFLGIDGVFETINNIMVFGKNQTNT